MKFRDHILFADGLLLGGLLAFFFLQEPYPSPGLAAFSGALAVAALLAWFVAKSRALSTWARAGLLLWETVVTFLGLLGMAAPLMFGWDGPPLTETALTLHYVGAGALAANMVVLLALTFGLATKRQSSS